MKKLPPFPGGRRIDSPRKLGTDVLSTGINLFRRGGGGCAAGTMHERPKIGSNKMKKYLLSAVALTAMVSFSGNAWADIVVAVAGPLTGANAAFGAQLQKGAEQAAADINAAGGINGEKIKVVLGDDVS